VQLKLSYSTFHPETEELLGISAKSTLDYTSPITVCVQGKWNSTLGTVLQDNFRLTIMNWFDTTISEPLQYPDDQPWGCEFGIWKEDCMRLTPGQPVITTHVFDEICPFSDPLLYALKRTGHEFSLTLKPQLLRWTNKSTDELFKNREMEIPAGEFVTWRGVELVSQDTLIFTVPSKKP
jgi:hypothetical protein